MDVVKCTSDVTASGGYWGERREGGSEREGGYKNDLGQFEIVKKELESRFPT